MKKRKLLSVLLVISIVMGMMPGISYAAQGVETENKTSGFYDMPEDWSTAAIVNAVNNGLLTGYGGNIMPEENLTRAQMAAIINRAFGATGKASLNSYNDVAETAWYYPDMAKAVQMKTFIGSNNKLSPESNITREEAFVVIARAFKLSNAAGNILDRFSDKALVSPWAEDLTAALVTAGYIEGSKGKLNPEKNITRAEIAQLMDNILKSYIKKAGTYTDDISGNVMINVPDVTLKDMVIKGDLIIGDGVGDGDITLDNVVVAGRTVIRGGGVNSIKITGKSDLQKIIVARINGQLRIYAEDGTEIGEMIVDGNDDVIIEGSIGAVIVTASDLTVTLANANVTSYIVEGNNIKTSVSGNSAIQTSQINGEDAGFAVEKGSRVGKIVVNGKGADISGEGWVGEVVANADNLKVSTPGTKVIVAIGVTGVIVGTLPVGDGKTFIVPGRNRPSTNEYRLTVVAKPEGKGKVTGSGLYKEGTSAKVTAEAINGLNYKFANWTSNGSVVSTQQAFDYNISGSNKTLVANFIPEGSIPVASAAELQDITYDLDKDYVQVACIDLNISPYNEDTGWVPIGDYDNRFTGSYNGNGYKITNLSIEDEYADSAGLFGVIDSARLLNVDLQNIEISAHNYVGGLVGTSFDSSIKDSRAEGSIEGEYLVGGLVGLNEGGSITDSLTDGTVNGDYLVGGIAGANGISGTIKDCSSKADVSGYYMAGGLLGQNLGNVDNCFTVGNITAREVGIEAPEIQAARLYSLGSLYESIARQPEAAETLVETAKELVYEAVYVSSPEVEIARMRSLSSLYSAIARQPEAAGTIMDAARELAGEAGDMSSPEVQAARVASFSTLYQSIARQPVMAETLMEAARELAGEAGDMSSPEVQAARVYSFSVLYDAIARQPEMAETLMEAARELSGEAGDMSSSEVQAARVESFSALYEALARQPEMAETLMEAARELAGEAGDMSSPEVQAARVYSFSSLYESIARQPEMAETLMKAAREFAGEAGDMSSPEVQTARVYSFSSLYESIARQPEMAETLMEAARELAGEAGDMSSPEVQAARVYSFSSLYESIERQPEMAETLMEAARELAGEAGDMSSPEVQAARVASFSTLYEAIARQPEAAETLMEAARELAGEAGDMSSPELQAARVVSFGGLYMAIAIQPEAAETLMDAARELAGEAGDMSSPQVQVSRVRSIISLYQAIATNSEAVEILMEAAREMSGEAGDMSPSEVQSARAVSFATLYQAIAVQPEAAEVLLEAAREFSGEAEDRLSPEAQEARIRSLSGLYDAIARQPEMSEVLIDAAREFSGEARDMLSPEVQALRVYSFSVLYDAIARQPEAAEVLLDAARELSGEKGEWTSAEIQALRARSFGMLFESIARQPEMTEKLTETAKELTGEKEDWLLPKVQTGGLVGVNSGTITACYSMGEATGRWYSGGIVGNNSGTITDSFAVSNKLKNSADIVEGLSSGRIAGINTGTLERNYANKLMKEPFAGAFEKKDMIHTRKDGGNLASWSINDDGKIAAVPEGYMLSANPAQVTVDENFDMFFALTLTNDTVTGALYSSDIQLGGSFLDLSLTSVQMTDETTVAVHVYGNLTELGEGTITLSKDVLLLSPEQLTATVTVVPTLNAYSNSAFCLVFNQGDRYIERRNEEEYIPNR